MRQEEKHVPVRVAEFGHRFVNVCHFEDKGEQLKQKKGNASGRVMLENLNVLD